LHILRRVRRTAANEARKLHHALKEWSRAGAATSLVAVGWSMAHSSPARGARIETRRAVLRRGARAALGGAATALLAACSSPVNIVVSSPTTTTVARTATPATPPTLQATSAPPQPRPAAPMGAGVNAGTPVGTPRIPEGFARAPLRVIHAAPAMRREP
jgi:hypothetical protein